jgi:transcription initiation factor IIE alpha subunit
MKVFKKKDYRNLGHSSRKFQHEITSNKEMDVRICSVCGKPNAGKVFYCPKCNKYYGLECAVHTMGGFTCPLCDEVTFLKTVKVVS